MNVTDAAAMLSLGVPIMLIAVFGERIQRVSGVYSGTITTQRTLLKPDP